MKPTTPALVGVCPVVVRSAVGSPLVAARPQQQVIGEPNVEVHPPNDQVSPGEGTTLDVYLSDGGLMRDGASEHPSRVRTARGTVVELETTVQRGLDDGTFAGVDAAEAAERPHPPLYGVVCRHALCATGTGSNADRCSSRGKTESWLAA